MSPWSSIDVVLSNCSSWQAFAILTAFAAWFGEVYKYTEAPDSDKPPSRFGNLRFSINWHSNYIEVKAVASNSFLGELISVGTSTPMRTTRKPLSLDYFES